MAMAMARAEAAPRRLAARAEGALRPLVLAEAALPRAFKGAAEQESHLDTMVLAEMAPETSGMEGGAETVLEAQGVEEAA